MQIPKLKRCLVYKSLIVGTIEQGEARLHLWCDEKQGDS